MGVTLAPPGKARARQELCSADRTVRVSTARSARVKGKQAWAWLERAHSSLGLHVKCPQSLDENAVVVLPLHSQGPWWLEATGLCSASRQQSSLDRQKQMERDTAVTLIRVVLG